MAQETFSTLTYARSSHTASDVLELQHRPMQEPADGEVAVQLLHAPINPLDLLVIAGKYPILPRFHTSNNSSIPGFDGVGRIMSVGKTVGDLKPGDLVIPLASGLGTWRTKAVWPVQDVVAVPQCNDTRAAALMRMAVLPAYFLLEDMCDLRPGDWVIQNAGTSTVAQLFTQLAKLRGVKVISVFRDRRPGAESGTESNDETRLRLHAAGADIALPDSELDTTTELNGKNIVLALDTVWGTSAERLIKQLANSGTFVNFGVLGGINILSTPLHLTHEALFGRLITVKSFRTSESLAKRSRVELQALLGWLVSLFNSNVIEVPPMHEVQWHDSAEVKEEVRRMLKQAEDGDIGLSKLMLKFPSNDN